MSNIYIALLHFPVYNKRGAVVTTCITGFDLHDIARSAATYGIKKYFVVNPFPAQREFAQRIFEFWQEDESQEFNWTRAEAFRLILIKPDLDEVLQEIENIEGVKPGVIGTSAKPRGNVKFEDLRLEIRDSEKPYLLLFGTGWGMAEELFSRMDRVLPPITGKNAYNHLSVRAATAIILDRLLGQ